MLALPLVDTEGLVMADISEPAPIGATLPADRHGQQGKRDKDEQKRQADSPAPPPAGPRQVADITEVMGIPVAEISPKVRRTLDTIMAEFDKVRVELDNARSHISYLEDLADRHPVLPLLNRRGLHRQLSRTLALAARAGVSNSFVCLHIAGLEIIRRRLGREAVEAALTLAAQALNANVRESDIVGSLGGGDFGVILTIAGDESAAEKAAGLAAVLAGMEFSRDDETFPLRASYGLRTFAAGDNAETVLSKADRDMLARQ